MRMDIIACRDAALHLRLDIVHVTSSQWDRPDVSDCWKHLDNPNSIRVLHLKGRLTQPAPIYPMKEFADRIDSCNDVVVVFMRMFALGCE
jgi:hypothetical protein